jgi:hypothetical protein
MSHWLYQLAASYNLEQVLDQVREMSKDPPEPIVDRHPRIDNDGGRLEKRAARARAFRSRCQPHRKRESQHRVSDCDSSGNRRVTFLV